MRLALGSESCDDIDDLGDGAWQTGDAHCSPVLLARDLTRVLHEPKLLDRVRVAGSSIRVITSRPRMTRGSPYSRSSRRARASRSTRLDWRPTEHSLSRSSAQACIPCLARRLCWRDGLLLQAHPTKNGNGTRANHGRKRPCACATAKKLAPISREERAERRATGDVPARP